MAKKGKKKGILGLILALIAVVVGGVLFVGAVGGWFNEAKVILDEEYYCSEECEERLMDLTASDYEGLVGEKKSFLVFVDQGGCTTADRLRGYMEEYAKNKGFLVYKIIFSEAKNSSLHDYVKYYPSVAMIDKGNVVDFLRADSDEDAILYNNYEAFEEWMEGHLVLK